MRLMLLGIIASLLVVGCGLESTGPPFKPVADVTQLMAKIIDPAADIVWDAVGTIISEESVEEWYPDTEDEWLIVEGSAMTIAESGNLLMLGDRARDQDLWMQKAQALVDAGMLAYEAAQSRNVDSLFEIGETVYNACDSCHSVYWVGDEDRGRVRSSQMTE